jgi:hypothetical protein
VKHWLQQQPFQVMQWPSKSPDLSWIENMRAFVSKEMTKIKGFTPENFEQRVWATLHQIWMTNTSSLSGRDFKHA